MQIQTTIMTPKQEAKKLIKSYYLPFPFQKLSFNFALIAVDKIIEQWEIVDAYLADGQGELNPNLKYWLEVKDEILKSK